MSILVRAAAPLMPNPGHFLELSLPVENIQDSLDFYRRLGWTELPVNDVRRHYYSVVTDGRIAIGLHTSNFELPALSFVSPDVARLVRTLRQAGHRFAFCELGEETFHEAELASPDDDRLRFIEARTFSPHVFHDAPAPSIGRTRAIGLPCRERDAAIAFWSIAGFVTDDDAASGGEPAGSATLRAPGIALSLRADLRAGPVLYVVTDDPGTTVDALEEQNLPYRSRSDGLIITSPDGMLLIVHEQPGAARL